MAEHETDLSAIAQGLITVTPLDFNMTQQTVLTEMEKWQIRLSPPPENHGGERLMTTFKVAGTLRVPSARGYRRRQSTGTMQQPSRQHGQHRGRRHTDHDHGYMVPDIVPGACYFMCLMFVTGCGLEGPIPSGPKRNVAAAAQRSRPRPRNRPAARQAPRNRPPGPSPA